MKPTNCATCSHESRTANQCWLLCGETDDNTVIQRAAEIRVWRKQVSLHDDWDWSAKFVKPTDQMIGCPYWEDNLSPR